MLVRIFYIDRAALADPPNERLILAGFTHVVSAVGNALMKSQTEMIDAAIKTGVTHFYASEWNSDISQPEISGMRYFRDK